MIEFPVCDCPRIQGLGTLSFTYGAAGHLASIAPNHANGVSMSYAFDNVNRLSTVTDKRLTDSNVTTYTYDSASNVAMVRYPNGVQSTFTYDALNRETSLSSSPASYTRQDLRLRCAEPVDLGQQQRDPDCL
jgi:YD repeat-containing protein